MDSRYISGFFDGDGSICVEKCNGGYTLRVKLFQSNEEFIDKIHTYYPFFHKSQQPGKKRVEFSLRASGRQILPLLEKLLEGTILKYEQVLEAKAFLDLRRGMRQEKECIYQKMKLLKVQSFDKPYARLCKVYIAGLFDAEGSIGIYKRGLRVKLTQKSDETILKEIGKMYNNNNKLNNYAICFYGHGCKSFLKDMQEFCLYKLPQINIALDFLSGQLPYCEACTSLKALKLVN